MLSQKSACTSLYLSNLNLLSKRLLPQHCVTCALCGVIFDIIGPIHRLRLSLVISRLTYNNSLHLGRLKSSMLPLRLALTVAGSLVYKARRSYHVNGDTPRTAFAQSH